MSARPATTFKPAVELAQRAARLYPDSEYLQAEWVRAVQVVRKTTRGWLLDRRLTR